MRLNKLQKDFEKFEDVKLTPSLEMTKAQKALKVVEYIVGEINQMEQDFRRYDHLGNPILNKRGKHKINWFKVLINVGQILGKLFLFGRTIKNI